MTHQIKYNLSNSLVGKVLISSPSMPDNRFYKAVILLTKYTTSGYVGIVLNKVSAHTFSHILKSIVADANTLHIEKNPNTTVVLGGPMHLAHLFVVHSNDYSIETTEKIKTDLYITNSTEVLIDMSKGCGPVDSIISIGCVTWTAGQLEDELKGQSWFIGDCDASIFQVKIENRYDVLAQQLGLGTMKNAAYFYEYTGNKK